MWNGKKRNNLDEVVILNNVFKSICFQKNNLLYS